MYERNFKNFSEHEFQDIVKIMDWNNILMIDKNDPNYSMNNLHLFINNILDTLAPYKKLSKKELKLKTKPWVNNETLSLMNKRDKILYKYSKFKLKDSDAAIKTYEEYKLIRNRVTTLKRVNKREYYKEFFDFNKNKMSSIWKGIRSLVNIKTTSRKDIIIVNNKGKKIIDPKKIAQLFNEHYAKVGSDIEKKIPKPLKEFHYYL